MGQRNDDDPLPDWALEDGERDQERGRQSQSAGGAEERITDHQHGSSSGPGDAGTEGVGGIVVGPGNGGGGSTDNRSSRRCCCARRFDWREVMKRDGRLLLITVVILILINIPYIKWVLYPFTIFSTWIHEMCHGIAAIMVGGRVHRLLIFPDTSGLAYTSIPGGNVRRAFVAAAGYTGTAVVGCILLLFRRTKRGPRTGTITLAVVMLLSAAVWIRNAFGVGATLILGVALGAVGWKVPSARMRDVYVCVAVTCALNAITSVRDLFGSAQVVNGQPSETDAHTVSDVLGGPFWFYAVLWLFFAIVMTGIGLIFAVPGPDEVADFQCCGVCVDLGLFNVCNKRRQRSEE